MRRSRRSEAKAFLHRGDRPLSKLPEYEIYAIRYAKQDKKK